MASTTTDDNIDEETPDAAASSESSYDFVEADDDEKICMAWMTEFAALPESSDEERLPEESGKEKEKEEEREGPRFRDLVGMEKVLEELKMEVLVPLYNPELARGLGVPPMQGILLHGPPGCGQTKLAHAIANETARPFHNISARDIVNASIGESKKKIRELFSKANLTAPSIILIDEIHAIASRKEYLPNENSRQIVTQLMTCMDASQRSGYVLVIGVTNMLDFVDPAMRRPGRFDREIFIGVLDESARAGILSKLTRNKKVEGSFDLLKIAKSTPGFVEADLDLLVKKAGNLAIKRIIRERQSELLRDSVNEEEWWKQKWLPEEMEKLEIVTADFEEAVKLVPPSLRREGFSSMPQRTLESDEMTRTPEDSGKEKEEKREGPRFRDLGGMEKVLEELKMEVLVPLYHPELLRCLGVRPMQGILLHGPPGCGKTKLAHAIANETGRPFHKISAPDIVSGFGGESEENIRNLFSKANITAPSIIFIDEIDAIASKRENMHNVDNRRIVTQLMTCMDAFQRTSYVLVIGATNMPDDVDPALRRPGRFDREIFIGIPDESARADILSKLTCNKKVEGSFDILKIARSTPGFVGADLDALVNKAGNLAINRIISERKSELLRDSISEEEWLKKKWLPEEMEKLEIVMADFKEAVKLVQPSSRREGFSSIPNVKWEDVGGLDFLRKEFDRYIVRRIKFQKVYEGFGMDLETGFLLYGPPGCGKTLIAKAVANEAGANFIHIKGPELLNKWVGESELAVRKLFSRARTCSPCILFFDEIDALTATRGYEGVRVAENVLNQLLIELDGADQRRGVYVIGATNRPDVMDKAMLRPGRLGKLVYIPLPSPDERGLILKTLGRKKPIDSSVDLSAIGRMGACNNFSGADLAALMNEAAMVALEEKLTAETNSHEVLVLDSKITTPHFVQALSKISPSVSEEQKEYYRNLSKSFKA